jgi:uncharacterized protein (UPF0548 family)
VLLIRRPSDARLTQILDGLRRAPLTYDEVAATRDAAVLPDGYHHMRATRLLGVDGDSAVFAAACEALRTWQLHRRQGFRVVPDEPPIEPGTDVVVAVPLPGAHVVAACRIVWTVDEPGRFGFGYGTLAVHPERGEEAFVVEREPSGEVRGTVAAFSRPRHPLVRLAGPMARRQQATATRGYLDAWLDHVRDLTS